MRRRWRQPLMTVNNIPMMNADIVTGVSLCLFFVAVLGGWNSFVTWMENSFRLTAPRLSMGFGTLLLAHISFNIPYVILNVGPKLRQMDKNLVDAAQDLGCTWMQAFWKVIIPEIKPGIVSGALISFTMSIDDFVLLLHCRLVHPDPGHVYLRHDQKAGDAGDQRRLHPAVRCGADPAGHRERAGGPGGESRREKAVLVLFLERKRTKKNFNSAVVSL
jgi:hypothetical protein